jgi:hypothetical protein
MVMLESKQNKRNSEIGSKNMQKNGCFKTAFVFVVFPGLF